tara:strand:+ start:5499 stop:6158 length:660 start_codon:yes stop_codon:yes gene_type:complete
MIVTFSGMDGAGKTTQINKLISKLENQKKDVSYIWARGGYTIGFELLKKIIRKVFRKSVPEAGYSKARKKIISRPYVSWVWLNIAMFDMAILYGVIVRLKLLFGDIVICDRYIDDTALDFKLNFPHMSFENMFIWKLLNFVAPRPDKSFLFLIPVEVSMQRSLQKNEPFPDSKDTLLSRLNSYNDNNLFCQDKYFVIDGTKNIEEVESIIIEVMETSVL